jgi:hypothetical protein
MVLDLSPEPSNFLHLEIQPQELIADLPMLSVNLNEDIPTRQHEENPPNLSQENIEIPENDNLNTNSIEVIPDLNQLTNAS